MYAPPALIWLPEDALQGRCSVADVGTLRPGGIDLAQPDGTLDVRALARRLAPVALMHLARLAGGEGRSAVQACEALLAWAYESPRALAATSSLPGTGEWPDWLTAQRLRYADERSTNHAIQDD